MNAIILSIGDELASGLTINTNAAWLSQQLAATGIRTLQHLTVPDDVPAITSAIRQAHEHLTLRLPADSHRKAYGILLITGGLGPTEDDLTRQALADAMNQELIEDPDAFLQIERWFKKINRPMSPSNRLQALRPVDATILENTAGTAPGLKMEKDNILLFVTPGVPREMTEMFTRSILPAIQELQGEGEPTVTQVAKINTFGMGESVLGEKIKDLMTRPAPGESANTLVGTTVHDGIVSVRIYSTGPRQATTAAIESLRQTLHQRLGPLIFSENDEPLESAVADLLKTSRYTIATAESCTGGLLATLLTNVPGSSAYFQRGWITYANAAKHEDLSIPEDLIQEHGAVSEPVARAMAEGAKKFAETDFALSTTGIAGPDGGTPEKPVGTVWIALASPDETLARKFTFPGNRTQIRLRAAQMSLALLRWKLLGVPAPI